MQTCPTFSRNARLMVDSNSILVSLGATFITSCTLVSDFDVHACREDSECAFPEGDVARCEQQRCVRGCRDNHNCASWDPRTPICPSVDSNCVSLTSSGGECGVSTGYVDETMGSLVARDMLIVGALVPAPKSAAWLTLELATSEIATNGGLPDLSGVPRPVVAVACGAEGGALEPIASHLIDDLGVSGVVTTLDAASLSSAFGLPAIRDSMLMMSARGSAADPAIAASPMLRQLGAPATSAANLYPVLIDRINQGLIARRGDGTLPRVVSLVSEAAEDIALADAVLPTLTLEGAGAQELLRQDRHRRLTLSDVDPDRRASVLADVIAYAPDIVLTFAGGFFAAPGTEERSRVAQVLQEAATEGTWSPIFVFGPANVGDSALRVLARESPSFRARAVGITSAPAHDSALARALEDRFLTAFPLAEAEPSALAYDAYYQIAYGLVAARGNAREGDVAALLEGLARIADPSAPAVPVGPDGLASSIGLLSTGAAFNLMGVTGAALGSRGLREAAPGAYCFGAASKDTTGARGLVDLVFDDLSAPSARVGRECAEEALP